MFNKILFTVSFVIISCLGHAQKDINDYKYIIIPKSFEFSKSDDQYQLNSLTKFLFNKYGYEAYFVEELPEDLKSDRCLGLMAEVSNGGGSLFKTKLEITLKDCYDVVIMKSQLGESRVKEYKKAYNEALRGAFETFQNFNYEYTSKENVEAQPKETSKIIETKVKPKDVTTKTAAISSNEVKQELYYAQAITNGFQLVNSEPKVVMILLNSSAKDVFIVKDKNAIVFNKEGQWIYSENNGASTKEKILNIKF